MPGHVVKTEGHAVVKPHSGHNFVVDSSLFLGVTSSYLKERKADLKARASGILKCTCGKVTFCWTKWRKFENKIEAEIDEKISSQLIKRMLLSHNQWSRGSTTRC